MYKFRQKVRKFITFVALLSMLGQSLSPFLYILPRAAYAQEATITPTDTTTPTLTDTVTPSPAGEPTETPTPTDIPTEEITPTQTPIESGQPTQPVDNLSPPTDNPSATLTPLSEWTFEKVEIGKEYVAPQNSGVKLTFTKLPDPSGNIKIEEITLTKEQIQQTGSLSDKAYDITSDMADGSFTYNLSLPIPESSKGKAVEVKFAEELSNIGSAAKVENILTNTNTSVSVESLNHFTIFVVVNPSPPPTNHLQDIVDNSDPSFEIVSGVWRTSTSVTGYYGSNYVTTDNHAGVGQIRWNFTPTQSGTQEIFTRWTAAANRGTAVPFTVTNDGGDTTVPVNEELNNGTWISLGTYPFTAGNSYSVTLTNNSTNANDFVVGDAIKLQNVSDPTEVWVDDSWVGTSVGTDLGSGKIFGYSAFSTIQAGITGVSSDGTINVAAGTYDEQVVIDSKNLTLQGVGDTTIIRPSAPTTLATLYTYPTGVLPGWIGVKLAPVILVQSAANVTVRDLLIDGTNVTSLPTGASRLSGVLFGESGGLISNLTINSIKTTGYADRTYVVDVSVGGATARSVEIANNTIDDYARTAIQAQGANLTANIHDNTIIGPGTISGQVPNGIVFIQDAVGTASYNTLNAMHYSGTGSRSGGLMAYSTTGIVGITFSNNEVYDTDDAIILALNATHVTVGTGNNFHDNGVGIQIENGATNNTITGNTITGSTIAGIRLTGASDPSGAGTPPGTGNVANSNTLTSNTLGVANYDAGQTFNATNNWWGNASGPYDNKSLPGTPDYNNPSGTGNSVTSYVDYKPWYKDAAMTILSNTAPAVPTLVSPADGAYVQPAGLVLDWSDVTDPSTPITYYYQSSYSSTVGSNNALTSPIYTSGALTTSQIDASGTADGTYYWQVRTCDSIGNCSDWSGPWKVVVDNTAPGIPGTPSTTSPTNSPSQTWTWTAATDALSGIASYAWRVVGGPSGSVLGTSTSAITDLLEGVWDFFVKAIDNAGNTGSESVAGSLTVDTTAPNAPTPTSPADGAAIQPVAFSQTWSAEAEAVQYKYQSCNVDPGDLGGICTSVKFEQTLSGTTKNVGAGQPNSHFWWRVQAKDAVGNWSVYGEAFELTIDGTAPSSDPSGFSSNPAISTPTSNQEVNVSWTTGGIDALSGVDGYSYDFTAGATDVPDNTKDLEETATNATSTTLADGTWYFHIRTVDNAGNWTSTAHFGPFVIDTSAPGTPSFASSSHALITWNSDKTIDISWSAPADPSGIAGYSYLWNLNSTTVPDEVSEGTGTSNTSTNRPTSQSIYFHVRAVDALDHWGSTLHYGPFWIDATNPTGSWVTPSNNDYLRSTVNLEVSPNDVGSGVKHVVFRIKPTGGAFTTLSTDTTNPYQGLLNTTTKTDGTYVLQAQIVDDVNRSVNKNINVTIDNTSPNDPEVSSTSHSINTWSNDNTVDVSWSGATDNLSGVAGYSYEWDTNSSTVPDQVSEGASTSTTSPALSDSDSHWFHLSTVDSAGNWTSTVHLGPFYIDTTLPTTPSANPPADDYTSDQSVSLTSSDTNGYTIYYTTNGDTPNSSSLTSLPITVDKDMTIKAIAIDPAGNISDMLTATYGIPPIISGEFFTRTSDTSLTVNWTTDDLSTSRVIYDTVSHTLGSTPNYGYAFSTAESDTTPKVISHSVLVTGLATNTDYYFRTISGGSPEAVGGEQQYTIHYIFGLPGDGKSDGKSDGGSSGGGGGGGGVAAPSGGGGVLGATTFAGAGTTGEVLGTGTQETSTETTISPTTTPEKEVLGANQPKEKETKNGNFLAGKWWLIPAFLVLIIISIVLFKRRKKKNE